MNGPGRRFDPSELLGGSDQPPTEAELADAFAAARALEAHASADRIGPTEGFEDRVMAAIAAEPAPRVVLRPAAAVRGARAAAFLVALRDAWAIATGQGRPIAVRAQALGFLMVVVLAAGSLGTVAAVGVGSLLSPRSTPAPSVQPITTPSQPAEPLPSPSPSPGPSATPPLEPSASSAPTAEPSETAEPSGTPHETETPDATEESTATETPDATDDSSEPDDTPSPAETLKPGETPDATDDHGGGSGPQ